MQYKPNRGPRHGTIYIHRDPGTHSAIAAAMLSALLFGGGQFYNGQRKKALAIFVSVLALAFIGNAILAVLWMASVVDAIFVAAKIDAGNQVSPWESF